MDGGDLIAAAVGAMSTFLVTQANDITKRRRDRSDADAERRRKLLDELKEGQDRLFSTLRDLDALRGNDEVAVLLANVQLDALSAQIGDDELKLAIEELSNAFKGSVAAAGDPNVLESSLDCLWSAWVAVRDRAVALRRELDRETRGISRKGLLRRRRG